MYDVYDPNHDGEVTFAEFFNVLRVLEHVLTPIERYERGPSQDRATGV